jgi:phage protein U
VFAILGDIVFEVVSSPENFTSMRQYHYVEHRVVQNTPQLQWLADGLETLEFEMLLHSAVADPALRLFELETAAALHEALPLVFGNGDFRGFFVIAAIGAVSHQLSAAGDPLVIRARMVLREWPLAFDPNLPPVPNFTPLGLASAAVGPGSGASLTTPAPQAVTSGTTTLAAAGVSAMLTLGGPSGPNSPGAQPGDISTATITRSALS